MFTREEASAAYDRLYARGQAIFTEQNPCNIRQMGTTTLCYSRRVNPDWYSERAWHVALSWQAQEAGDPNRLCCTGCKHWNKGCTVQALSCKLWICHDLRQRQPELKAQIDSLRKEMTDTFHKDGKDFPQIRESKEEFLDRCYPCTG